MADDPDEHSTAISLRAYARHRNTSAPSVLRAVRSGRLNKSLVYEDGKAKVADVALADQEWAANTDLTKAPTYVKERPAPPPPVKTQSKQPPTERTPPTKPTGAEPAQAADKMSSTLAEAATREKDWKAKLAELDYQERIGLLVNADEVKTRIVDTFTQCRTKLLGIPSKAASTMPELTHLQLARLDALIREALEDLADDASEPAA